ncbi:MAG: excinuclease ABC subunit UvrA, partial [Bacteroidales bacterium]|nr:excinuclease ABC subunit UvrA [Bacteroidales bacterium]
MKSNKPEFAEDMLVIHGARENNLQNISLEMPQHQLLVITGLSGSGKSSLAFDTLYAEGQRRYMETFSAYARQFIGNLEHPDVDKITGLNPVISIEQKTVNNNPRSTVGTITEVYDFLRLLYARVADAYSYETGEKMVKYTERELISFIDERFKGKKIYILAPVVKRRKGHYKELFETIRKQGFVKVRVDGEIRNLEFNMMVDRYKIHDIEAVIDIITINDTVKTRLTNSLRLALKQGKGEVLIYDEVSGEVKRYSNSLMCPTTGISYPEPEPNTFSFNSPYGACEKCNGLGFISDIDLKKIIPDDQLSIKKGALAPIGAYKSNTFFKQLEALAEKYKFSLDDPIKSLSENVINIILYGSDEPLYMKRELAGLSDLRFRFEGVINFMRNFDYETVPASIKKWILQFIDEHECPECHGSRLKKESLYFKIGDKNIAQLAAMDIKELLEWISSCEQYLSPQQQQIAYEVLREIKSRLQFLSDVGISYLSMNRPAKSLSG